MPSFDLENKYPLLKVIGIDEVGRGCLFGPVVAAAVLLRRDIFIDHGIKDSKKISKLKREILADYIRKHHFYGIGIASVEEIDEFNILEATKLAMQRAVSNMPFLADIALIDGNMAPKLNIKAETVIKGDNLSLSIAAASILAKVTRDKLIIDLAQVYPNYSLEKHMGYGTVSHIAAINIHGITDMHRKSFNPVKSMLK
jgi:ribonuclease HII